MTDHSRLSYSAALIAAAAVLAASLSGPAAALTYRSVTDLTAASSARDQQVAVSADGTRATAVWTLSGDHDVVQTASATISRGVAQWGAATTLSVDTQDADDPQVSLSQDGTRATAVWSWFDGTNWVVRSRSASIAGTSSSWGDVSALSAAGVVGQPAAVPQVDVSADGSTAVAVWQRGADDARLVQSAAAAVVGSTATWEAAKNVTSAGGDAVTPQVAISADGVRGTVVWARSTGVDPERQIQSRSGGTSANGWLWGGTLQLSDIARSAKEPQLALSQDGKAATVVWLRSDGSNDIVQTNSLTITGVSSFSSQTDDLSAAGQDAFAPEVSVSQSGSRAAAIWSRSAAAGSPIQSAHATVAVGAATWGSGQDVASGAAAAARPHIAVSDDGSVVSAIWLTLPGAKNRVDAATGTVAGTTVDWAAPQTLSTAGADANSPQFGVSSDGLVATAVWNGVVAGNSIIQSASAAQAQTITFAALPGTRVDQGPVTLTARSSSPLPVAFASLTPAVCRIQGRTAALVTAGTCTVQASQSGDASYLAAPVVRRSFAVTAVPVQTQLTVKARKASKKLMLRRKAAVVRSVVTDGTVTSRQATCYRKGVKAKRICRVKRASGRIVITPKCTTKVTARVRITAQARGAQEATFTRTWKVAKKPRKKC